MKQHVRRRNGGLHDHEVGDGLGQRASVDTVTHLQPLSAGPDLVDHSGEVAPEPARHRDALRCR